MSKVLQFWHVPKLLLRRPDVEKSQTDSSDAGILQHCMSLLPALLSSEVAAEGSLCLLYFNINCLLGLENDAQNSWVYLEATAMGPQGKQVNVENGPLYAVLSSCSCLWIFYLRHQHQCRSFHRVFSVRLYTYAQVKSAICGLCCVGFSRRHQVRTWGIWRKFWRTSFALNATSRSILASAIFQYTPASNLELLKGDGWVKLFWYYLNDNEFFSYYNEADVNDFHYCFDAVNGSGSSAYKKSCFSRCFFGELWHIQHCLFWALTVEPMSQISMEFIADQIDAGL